MGVEYQMENKLDSAILCYKKAVEIDSTKISIYESLIKAYWENQQPTLALMLIKTAPKEIKERSSLFILKGITLKKRDKLIEAMEEYKKVFAKTPKVEYIHKKNLMEFIGSLILQTVIGEKELALEAFDQLKENKLTASEKKYVNSIEHIIQDYEGDGYLGITGNYK